VENPGRIVLEITERTAITDYPTFQGYLKEFRDRGFRFAVDDAGSGYAGLGSIANLEPDFIKLDISLISGIDANFMKQNLVETMVQFANDHDIKVIAEGVEREEEYETVRRLGVHFTQGFLFHSQAAQAAQLVAAQKEAADRAAKSAEAAASEAAASAGATGGEG
jgi:EAL domain-containing protein (putative c-di-GMP-specific phosphodiesterase class I)